MKFNDEALRDEMFRLTSQGIIPSVLKAEMCLIPDVMLITKAVECYRDNFFEIYSQVFPGLKIQVWNKNGWELT